MILPFKSLVIELTDSKLLDYDFNKEVQLSESFLEIKDKEPHVTRTLSLLKARNKIRFQ